MRDEWRKIRIELAEICRQYKREEESEWERYGDRQEIEQDRELSSCVGVVVYVVCVWG